MKLIDLTGKKFGRLTVVEVLPERKHNKKVYKCACECGNYANVVASKLIAGYTKSCGCLKHDVLMQRNIKHGKAHTRLYTIYKGMKQRCYNKKDQTYKYYGSRGIVVCSEWLNDFMTFYNWAISNGYQDDLTIDRIDVDGNYEPYNCRWISSEAQHSNMRTNIKLVYNNKTQTIKQWSKELDTNYRTMLRRYHKGWSTKEILFGRKK